MMVLREGVNTATTKDTTHRIHSLKRHGEQTTTTEAELSKGVSEIFCPSRDGSRFERFVNFNFVRPPSRVAG